MNLTIDQRKQLIAKYPYLQPRNVWTDQISDDYDYSYINGEVGVPEGWMRLFLMYCRDIRPHLVSANMLDKFRFTQVKEKYGSIRIYNSGYPKTVGNITYMYEFFSEFICHRCGKLARWESKDYILPWCDDCLNTELFVYHKIYRKSVMYIEQYQNGHKEIIAHSMKPLMSSYKELMKMDDDEFINYILNT